MCRRSSWLPLLLLLLLVVVGPQPTMCKRKSAKSDMERRHAGRALADWTSDWATVADIPNLLAPEFNAQTRFLLEMCSNAYKYKYKETVRALPGPDDDDTDDDLDPIPGWKLSDTVSPLYPATGAAGLRALVYEEETGPLEADSARTVLVFRGWKTNSTSSDELADLCAGMRLFPAYVDFLSPPSHLCSYFFKESSLNYLSQAIAYTRLVLDYYDSSSLLLTGHGFGAGLAYLVSAALQNELMDVCDSSNVGGVLRSVSESSKAEQHTANDYCRVTLPVVSFSGPGVDEYLQKQGWTLYKTEYLITISHGWDYFSVRAKWAGHRGWLCFYNVTEPDTCTLCFSDDLRSSSVKALNSETSKSERIHKGKAKKKDDSKNGDEDDDDDDECPCHSDVNEPCWDCLIDTNTLEAVKREPDELPTCKFYD